MNEVLKPWLLRIDERNALYLGYQGLMNKILDTRVTENRLMKCFT